MASPKRIAIIGSGPVGLAAAAHTLERRCEPVIFEAGAQIGHAVQQWAHVRMFSPWKYNIDQAAQRLLAATGWNTPDPQAYPTGSELIEHYLAPLATQTKLASRLKLSAEVTAISRVGFNKVTTSGRENAPFEVRYRRAKGEEQIEVDAVIDTSGTWLSPNPAGANGLRAIGEEEAAPRISYGMPDVFDRDRARYANKTVAVLGSGHSAIGTILELIRLADQAPSTKVIWLVRGDRPEKAFGGGANDKLAARGALGSRFAQLVRDGRIAVAAEFKASHITTTNDRLRIGAGSACCGRHVLADELIVATGFRPDLSFLGELRLLLDPALECPSALAPLIDPNEHSCGTVRPHGARQLTHPEPGFYIAGMKSYGRAPTFLMLTGYEQVRSIAADIVGDRLAAEKVELELPETGVCSVSNDPAAEGCCGGPSDTTATACCASKEPATSVRQSDDSTAAPATTGAKTAVCCG